MNQGYLLSPSGILKIIEMVAVIIAFGILRGSNANAFMDLDVSLLGFGTMAACFLVTPVLLACYVMGKTEIQQTFLEFTLNFFFFLFLTIFGVVGMIEISGKPHGSIRDEGIAMCFFGLVAGVTYLADTVLAIIHYRN